jgi:hypothetical protein
MSREIDFRYAPEIQQVCIGFADDPYKTIIREDGSLNYGYQRNEFDIKSESTLELDARQVEPQHRNYKFTHRLKPEFTHQDELINREQEFGDPSEALVRTTETYEHTELTWTVFGYRDGNGLRADVVHWNLSTDDEFGRAPSTVRLALDGPKDELHNIVESPGSTAYWTEYGTRSRELSHHEFLESNESREGVFVIVLEGELDPETVTVDWATEARAETRQYWQSLDPFLTTFQIPDSDVQAMLESCGRNILQAREEHDGVMEYQVGPTEYRGLWIVDGHFLLEAAHMMGRGTEAFEQGILALLRRIKPSGEIQNLPKHDKETGIAMATIVRQCALADDDDRLRELWPTLRRGLSALENKRETAKEMRPDYDGIFPPAFLDGGIAGPFPEYTTPLWVLAGVKAAAEAGDRLDLEGAEEFWEFYDEIFSAFREASQRDQRNGYDRPQSATWAFAQAIYPGEVFEPDSEEVENLLRLLDAVDDTQGIPENTGWIHDQGIWTYSAMFYAQVWLYADRPEKAVDYLYSFANHAAPSRVWREEQSLTESPSAEFLGDMPHNWGSAEFIRMVRNIIVSERQGRLDLLPGLPEEWLPTSDSSLILEATPTRFGKVDISLTRDSNEFVLNVERDRGNQEPDAVRLYWDGKLVESVPALEAIEEGVWEFPADDTELTVRLMR